MGEDAGRGLLRRRKGGLSAGAKVDIELQSEGLVALEVEAPFFSSIYVGHG